MFRTNGQSDHYRAFATMWRGPDNLLHVFLTLMYPLEVITSFWYLRQTTVREIFKTQKSRDKLETKKRRQKQQRTNKNRKKTHRKLKVNEQPGLHHKMGAWTRCTGRALASLGGRTQHIGRQVHDSDRITFEVMTLILNLHRPALKAYQCAYKKRLKNIASLQQISFRFVWCMIFICVVFS